MIGVMIDDLLVEAALLGLGLFCLGVATGLLTGYGLWR